MENDICWCIDKSKQKIWSSAVQIFVRSTLKTLATLEIHCKRACVLVDILSIWFDIIANGLFQKKQAGERGWGQILKNPHQNFLFFKFTCGNFRQNSSTPGNSAKFYYIPWKFQGQKPRPLHLKFHMIFSWSPWKFHFVFN